jgi:hypothetical protein
MDLGSWLRSLGLGQYEAAFHEQAIDDTVLPHLTQDHLRQLGLPLGARIKLLAAIAELKDNLNRLSGWQTRRPTRLSGGKSPCCSANSWVRAADETC